MCKVSVIIIAYNIEGYITKCINSMINQTMEDIEIIVVNDGSTDKSLQQINNIALEDNRIKVINKKNEGPMQARIAGLDVASGDYIQFVDGDDWMAPDAIEKLFNKAKKEAADIILFNFYRAYNDQRLKASKSFRKDFQKKNDNIKCVMLSHILPSICTKFIKREFLIKNRIEFPSLSYAEDLATTVNIFLYYPSVSTIDENLYYYYQRDDSITKKVDHKLLDIPIAVDYIKDLLIERGIIQVYQKEFEYLAFTHIFYNKVICTSKYNEIHRKLMGSWKKHRIKIHENPYFIDFNKQCQFGLKLKMRFFNHNYNWGLFYIKLWDLVDIFKVEKYQRSKKMNLKAGKS